MNVLPHLDLVGAHVAAVNQHANVEKFEKRAHVVVDAVEKCTMYLDHPVTNLNSLYANQIQIADTPSEDAVVAVKHWSLRDHRWDSVSVTVVGGGIGSVQMIVEEVS